MLKSFDLILIVDAVLQLLFGYKMGCAFESVHSTKLMDGQDEFWAE
jgi:hypothetical protein